MGWRQGDKPEHDGVHEHTSAWTVDWDGKARSVDQGHPTSKPVELFTRPIEKHTQPGDVVFEPFSGSGSQIIAERTGRRCCAIEISPPFVDVAIQRWQKATGKDAIPTATAGRSQPSRPSEVQRDVPCPHLPRPRARSRAVGVVARVHHDHVHLVDAHRLRLRRGTRRTRTRRGSPLDDGHDLPRLHVVG